MKRKSATVLLAGFVLALAMLGGVAWIDWQYTVRAQETTLAVIQTLEVQGKLNRLLAFMDDIETGARGFVITGEPVFLEPFTSGVKAVAGQQRKLERLITDAGQKASLAALAPLIAERIALSQHVVGTRQYSGFEAAQQETLTRKGKAAMDRIRSAIARMQTREQALLEQYTTAARRDSRYAISISVGGSGLSVMLFCAVFALILRENRLRTRAQEEVLVREHETRTAQHETTLANDRLTAAAAELAQANQELAADSCAGAFR